MPVDATVAESVRRGLVVSMVGAAAFAAIGIVLGIVSGSQVILFDGAFSLLGVGLAWMALLASRAGTGGPSPATRTGRRASSRWSSGSRRRPAGHLRLRRLRGSRPSRRCRPPTAATPPTVRMTEVGSKLYVDAEYLTEPDRAIGETDVVRRALARALEELDLDAWLTVEFSADPTWDEPPPVH